MKIGVFAVLPGNKSIQVALKYLSKVGVQTVELGTGGYPGNFHLKPERIMSNAGGISALKGLVKNTIWKSAF